MILKIERILADEQKPEEKDVSKQKRRELFNLFVLQ